ncbi:hypothetical protein CR513_45273, partial [Mucuna pruriens]
MKAVGGDKGKRQARRPHAPNNPLSSWDNLLGWTSIGLLFLLTSKSWWSILLIPPPPPPPTNTCRLSKLKCTSVVGMTPLLQAFPRNLEGHCHAMVIDLFDIKQAKGESLKKYLACFNNVTIQVNDPNQFFFCEILQESDSLALRQLASMGEIITKVEKHIEAEEDQADQIQTEQKVLVFTNKVDYSPSKKTHHNRQGNKTNNVMTQFTPLKVGRSHIQRLVYHTQLLDIPPPTGCQLGSSWDE